MSQTPAIANIPLISVIRNTRDSDFLMVHTTLACIFSMFEIFSACQSFSNHNDNDDNINAKNDNDNTNTKSALL